MNHVKLLLEEYEKHVKLVESRKLKCISKIWAPIAKVLGEKGCNVDPLQVENKFKSLKRGYINVQKHNNRTGRDKKNCEFEE